MWPCLLEEPCGRSVPGSLFKCLAFLEAAAEVSPEKRLSSAQSIHNYLKEVEQGTTWKARQRNKAARIPVEVARAWEIGVLDVTLQSFKRIYCWYKLIKLWGGLRSHDSQGVPPSTLEFDPLVGLQGEILKAKTTGVGRRVEVVQFYVAAEAWLAHKDWLRVGLQLFTTMNKDADMERRDFLMCKPNESLREVFEKACSPTPRRCATREPFTPSSTRSGWMRMASRRS